MAKNPRGAGRKKGSGRKPGAKPHGITCLFYEEEWAKIQSTARKNFVGSVPAMVEHALIKTICKGGRNENTRKILG